MSHSTQNRSILGTFFPENVLASTENNNKNMKKQQEYNTINESDQQ